MNHRAQLVHEDGTPFTEAELIQAEKDSRCPECDALSAPELARRGENPEPILAGIEHATVVVRKRTAASPALRGPITLPDSPNERQANFIDLIPVRCPKHVLRPHPWIAAIKLEDLDTKILQNFVRGTVNGRVWVPMLAGPSNFPQGFCYQDREFSQAEVRAEIERRKTQPTRVENAMQKYQRLSRIPQFWISDSERKFLQSREAALVALKLRMR
jgi:hypothetical protein